MVVHLPGWQGTSSLKGHLHAWQKVPSEAEGLCLFPNCVVNAPYPRQGIQVLGFLTLSFQATSPIISASEQPGNNVLTWTAAEIFSHISHFTQGWGFSDYLLFCLFFLFWFIIIPHQANWFFSVFLFLYRGNWYRHGLVLWLSCSTCHLGLSSHVPVTWVWVAAVFGKRTGVAAGPVGLFSLPSPEGAAQ